jgi:hypothetical protein
MPRPLSAAIAVCLAVSAVPATVLAQGESAEPLRPHAVRLTVGADWSHWTERFAAPSPFDPALLDGTRQPIGAYFGAESLGTRQLGFLAPTESQLRALSHLNGWALNVGRAKLTMDASWRSTPIKLEYAISSRLGFSASVPIVRARMSVFLTGPDSANAATRGNVGFNKAWLTAGALDGFRSQADTALRALRAQATGGPLALRPQAQNEYNTLQPLVCGLYSLGAGSATDPTSPCYSASPVSQSVLLPLATSDAGDSLTVRLASDQNGYAALRAQYAGLGITLPAFTQGYSLPDSALDSLGIRRLFYDRGSPLASDSLNEVVRTGIGDIELGGWYQLTNRPHWRSQLALMVRLPTGTMDSPDNFVDLPTGDHQTDVEVALRNDVVASPNLWFHVGARYGVQMADQLTRRVSPWYLPFAPISSTAEVQRHLGAYWALDVVPNWQLDDAFGVGVGWHYYHQAQATFSYVDPADEARIGLPADVLGEATATSRMRVGAGVTFSTVERFARGRARLPYRVTWSYNTTFYGRGGQVPKAGVMQVMIQAFIGGRR